MGGYAKIFGRILDSTIWQEDDKTRILWITMLAMADQDGAVMASIPGLAARARISLEECEGGLAKFLEPDKYSINQEDEGRRIRHIDGGWFLINHAKYRSLLSAEDIRMKAALRQRERRDRVDSGIDEEMKRQQYKCDCCLAIFEKPYSLYVVRDHNHATGAYRALICQSCNKVVGQIENNKTTLSPKLSLCLDYVNRHSMSRDVTSNHHIAEAKAEAEAEADTKPQDDRELAVLEIAKLYPKIADPCHLSREHAGLILDAITRHGEKVLEGTRRFRSCFDNWASERREFAPGVRSFFEESQYLFDETKWDKSKKSAPMPDLSVGRKRAAEYGKTIV